MTKAEATRLRAVCGEAGIVGLVMHTEQWSENGHYVELPVPLAWEVADWQRAVRAAWWEEIAALKAKESAHVA